MEEDKRAASVREHLSVEAIGNDQYRGKNLWMDKFMRAVYGGQVMGQALMAACKSVFDLNPSFLLHSFHCYFVGPMQTSPDVTYTVNKVKVGHNFCSLTVAAVQSGKVCFHCLVSFQKPEAVKAQLDYTKYSKPIVPHPNDSVIFSELTKSDIIAISAKKLLLTSRHMWDDKKWPLDVYLCTNIAAVQKRMAKKPTKPEVSLWIRCQGAFETTDHQNYHRVALAYASDLLAGLVLHLYPKFKVGLMTSLDHSMWFHETVDAKKFYFHQAELEHSVNGKNLNAKRSLNKVTEGHKMEKVFSLRDQLFVKSLGNDQFMGTNLWLPKTMRVVYGGQVIGQALMAACKSVFDLNPSFLLHSIHCYYVGPTQSSLEVLYTVNRVKVGHNICVLSVVAVQNAKVCLHCLVSFHKPEAMKASLDYTKYSMPAVPHPNDPAISSELSNSDTMLAFKYKLNDSRWPMELYPCSTIATAQKRMAKQPTKPEYICWIRGQGTFEESDHQNYHRIALAYTSDMMMPMLVLNLNPQFVVGVITSLDHSMWFHEVVDAKQWYLHHSELEHSANGKQLNVLRIFDEDGKVIASCIQESLIRPKL